MKRQKKAKCDQTTNQPTKRQTDRAGHRVARKRLKRNQTNRGPYLIVRPTQQHNGKV